MSAGVLARGARQGERCLSMELRMTSSLRMQAVRANFFGFASSHQPLVEVPDDGDCSDWPPAPPCTRLHGSGRVRPKTVRLPRSVPLSRLKGSHSHQGGDLPAVQSAQLRQVGQEGEGRAALQRRGRCAGGRPSHAIRGL